MFSSQNIFHVKTYILYRFQFSPVQANLDLYDLDFNSKLACYPPLSLTPMPHACLPFHFVNEITGTLSIVSS
jgi:hypothetical protein